VPLRKGISHTPSGGQAIDEATRWALLMAIARSKVWVDTMIKDPGTDIGTIAERENLAERHVRFLAPLAYLSPHIE
jgi:site-specific DNA recombinase